MKKFNSILLIMISILLLVSCSNYTVGKESTSSTGSYQPLNNYENQVGEELMFSLDKGNNWQKADTRLEKFDIWDVKINEEVPGMVFFYATSYDQLLEEVEKNRTPSIYTYNYLDDDGWDRLLETYNEDYFEDYILIFYYKYEPNISTNYVYNILINENTLTLNINRFEGSATALSSWLELVTIKKVDVENVTNFNVHVRTISELVSSIMVSANKNYIRDICLNGLSVSDFPGLDNLKSVKVWTWGLTIDIYFNETMSSERLVDIIDVLLSSKNIRSLGYTSETWIRVTVSDKFYDEYLNKTLTLKELIGDEIENSDNFTILFKEFVPIVLITLEMEQHGRKHYEKMIEQLNELNYTFIENIIEVI